MASRGPTSTPRASPHGPVFALALAATLALAYLAYTPGLGGTFLFDDFATLPKLSEYGDLTQPRAFLYYVLGSGHDFGGRPLAHLSFLIDDDAWPSTPEPFKRTNVLLHLLAGILVIWLALLLGHAIGLDERRAAWGAMLAGGAWLLHPLWVSTTLYVVQRMAILSAILVLAGLVVYVRGRLALAAGRRRGLAGMALGIAAFTPLAFLSKENGALLPLLALVAELTVLRGLPVPDRARGAYRALVGLLLVAPNLAILGYFAATWDSVLAGYDRRTFTLGERLLTEPRALWSYLRELVLPRIQTGGLYHDDYPASQDLLTPWTTLPALLGLALAVLIAFRVRRTRPLLAFATLFFLAGHVLESSFISLELYFEHRSYLPSVGLFAAAGLAVARTGSAPTTARHHRLAVTASLATILLLAGMTWLRADLWGDPEAQSLVWVRLHPGSLRARQQAAITWLQHGRPDLAEPHIREAIRHHPAEPTLPIQLIGLLCAQRKPLDEALRMAEHALARGFASSGVYRNFENLLDLAAKGRCPGLDPAAVDHLLQAALRNPRALRVPGLVQDLYYLRALAALADGRPDAASTLMADGLRLGPRPEYALQAAAVLATHGRYDDALRLLDLHDRLERKNHKQASIRATIRSRLRRYDEEKRRLRLLILADRARAASGAGP